MRGGRDILALGTGTWLWQRRWFWDRPVFAICIESRSMVYRWRQLYTLVVQNAYNDAIAIQGLDALSWKRILEALFPHKL